MAKSLIADGLAPAYIFAQSRDENLSAIAGVRNVEVVLCSSPRDPAHLAMLRRLKPDLIVASGYSKIIPAEILRIPTMGAINCHGGRLPFYRGAAPIPWQIMRGEKEGGAYVLEMTEGIDDGPILASEMYPIGENETARDIVNRVDTIFSRLVPMVVGSFMSGTPPGPRPQPSGDACLWTRRYPKDGLVEWNRLTAREVRDFVRALDDPYPGAFTFCNAKRVEIKRVEIPDPPVCGVSGRFVGVRSGGPLIIAKDRAVCLLSYTVDGVKNEVFPGKYGDDMG